MEPNEKVWAPVPEGDGEIRATFLAMDVDKPIEVNGIPRDAAIIAYEEGDLDGTTGRVPYFKLWPRDG